MDNNSTPPDLFTYVVDRSNTIEQIRWLYQLGVALGSVNASFADAWLFLIGEMEKQIRAGWMNREEAAIERFDVSIEMTRGNSEWNVSATMMPVLQ